MTNNSFHQQIVDKRNIPMRFRNYNKINFTLQSATASKSKLLDDNKKELKSKTELTKFQKL